MVNNFNNRLKSYVDNLTTGEGTLLSARYIQDSFQVCLFIFHLRHSLLNLELERYIISKIYLKNMPTYGLINR